MSADEASLHGSKESRHRPRSGTGPYERRRGFVAELGDALKILPLHVFSSLSQRRTAASTLEWSIPNRPPISGSDRDVDQRRTAIKWCRARTADLKRDRPSISLTDTLCKLHICSASLCSLGESFRQTLFTRSLHMMVRKFTRKRRARIRQVAQYARMLLQSQTC